MNLRKFSRVFLLFSFSSISQVALSVEGNDVKTVIELSAINDFIEYKVKDFAPAYIDKHRQVLAVNAEHYKETFAAANYTFSGTAGQYDIAITTLTETDGDSRYKILINNKIVADFNNIPSNVDYAPYQITFNDITLSKGDKIQVQFSAETNKKLLEPDGISPAYARGRWKSLSLIPR